MELARLSAQVSEGLRSIDRRFDHVEHALEAITVEVKRTNGRVSELETADAIRKDREIPRETLTRSSLQWYVVLVMSVIAGTVTVLQFFGVLSQ